MTVSETCNYLLFTNPVSSGVWNILGSVSKNLKPKGSSQTVIAAPVTAKVAEMTPLWKLAGNNFTFVRIAALSGASAVFLGAWGAHHTFKIDKQNRDLKQVFETANRYHFFHTLALLAIPLAHRPVVSGSMMLAGMTLFSGTLYYRAFTGDDKFNRLAPAGGILLMLAWLSLVI